MSWTKRQFIDQAYAELGYASEAYDLPETTIITAKYRLDSLMATWNGRGINLGYTIPEDQTSADIDDESGVPDYAYEAIYTNLAVRLAPSIGKAVPQELRKIAREGYRVLSLRSDFPEEMQYPDTLPRGQGNKPWIYTNPYFPTPEDRITVFEGGEVLDLE